MRGFDYGAVSLRCVGGYGEVDGAVAGAAAEGARLGAAERWQSGARRAGIADTLAAVQPDVVMLSESSPERVTNLLSDLAARGLTYFDNKYPADSAVISRHPIVEFASFPSWSKAVVSVDGTEVVAYSGHLEYQYYVTYLPRGYGGGAPAPLETSEYGWNEIPTGPITDVDLIERLNTASGRTKRTKTVTATG